MTVVDLALYRSLEGEFTPTICWAHALLAVCSMSNSKPYKKLASFLRVCLGGSNDALSSGSGCNSRLADRSWACHRISRQVRLEANILRRLCGGFPFASVGIRVVGS